VLAVRMVQVGKEGETWACQGDNENAVCDSFRTICQNMAEDGPNVALLCPQRKQSVGHIIASL
jgi:hypothetical protein